jgi:hypothetical protein
VEERKMDLQYSNHAAKRMQQRAIKSDVVDIAWRYGLEEYHKGATVIRVDTCAISKIKEERLLCPKLENKLRKIYLVERGGLLVTVGYKTRRHKRNRK